MRFNYELVHTDPEISSLRCEGMKFKAESNSQYIWLYNRLKTQGLNCRLYDSSGREIFINTEIIEQQKLSYTNANA